MGIIDRLRNARAKTLGNNKEKLSMREKAIRRLRSK
jgi:hypothetical protein